MQTILSRQRIFSLLDEMIFLKEIEAQNFLVACGLRLQNVSIQHAIITSVVVQHLPIRVSQ